MYIHGISTFLGPWHCIISRFIHVTTFKCEIKSRNVLVELLARFMINYYAQSTVCLAWNFHRTSTSPDRLSTCWAIYLLSWPQHKHEIHTWNFSEITCEKVYPRIQAHTHTNLGIIFFFVFFLFFGFYLFISQSLMWNFSSVFRKIWKTSRHVMATWNWSSGWVEAKYTQLD